MEALILLALLQVKHCVADFYLQSYKQTVKKGLWLNPIGISHSLEHAYCSLIAILAFSFVTTISLPLVVFVVLCESVIHYIIDFAKVRFGCKDSSSPLFWNQFGLDQLLHQLTYIGMVYLLL